MGKIIYPLLALLISAVPLGGAPLPPPLPKFRLPVGQNSTDAPDSNAKEKSKPDLKEDAPSNQVAVDESGMREAVYFEIKFDVGPQAPAVIFEENDSYILVFNKAFEIPTLKFPSDLAELIALPSQPPLTIARLRFKDKTLMPEFQSTPKGWRIIVSQGMKDIPEIWPIDYQAKVVDSNQLILSTGSSEPLITFTVDDQTYTAQPHNTLGYSNRTMNRIFQVIPTWVGLLLKPSNSGVAFSLDHENIHAAQKDPPVILAQGDLPKDYYPSSTPLILDLRKWDVDPELTAQLIRNVRSRISRETNPFNGLVDLGKLFLAQGFYHEALSIAREIYQHHPHQANAEVAFLHDLALILSHPNLDFDYPKTGSLYNKEAEFSLLRGLDLIAHDDSEKAQNDFAQCLKLIQSFPKPLRNTISLKALQASISINKPQVIFRELITKKLLDEWDQDLLTFLDAKLQMGPSNKEKALMVMASLSDSSNRLVQQQSQLERLQNVPQDLKSGIRDLEALRFTWRGDAYEANYLKKLAQAYEQAKNYRRAIMVNLTLQDYLPRYADPKVQKEKISELMLKQLNRYPPNLTLKKLAFYYEFDDYLPVEDNLFKVTAGLVQDLLKLKLVKRAEDLLVKKIGAVDQLISQTKNPGKYTPIKSQIQMQLANLQMTYKRPMEALGTYEQIVPDTVTNEDRFSILQNKVRAMAQTGQYDRALELLKNPQNITITEDQRKYLEKLKGQIYLSKGSWDEAAACLEPLVLSLKAQADPMAVLDLTVAYVQQNDQEKLDALKQACLESFKDPKQKDAFLLLSTPPQKVEVTQQSLEEQLKSAENTKKVIEALRQDYFK